MRPDLQCDPAARHGAEDFLQRLRIRTHSLLLLYLPRFIQHAVPAVAISKIQSDGQCGLRNIPALLRCCGANLLHCRSPLSFVPLSTSIDNLGAYSIPSGDRPSHPICLRHLPGTATIAAFCRNLHITIMRRSFPRFRIAVALLIASIAQSQTTDSIFLRGQLAINGDTARLTVDSDHSNVRITNPDAVRAEQNRKVVLHAVSTKDGIQVISSASLDDQNKPDDFSFAAIVAERKDVAMVERLLQLGANPNAKDQDGISALVVAMSMGDQTLMPVTGFNPNVEITALLLDHGASPDTLNKNWQTPLMAAACFGDVRLVKLFIDHKANVNIGNKFGMTALMYSRSFAKVKMLIAAGASVNAKNDKNMSPLHLAQLELAADRSTSNQSRGPEHEKQVQSVIDLLVAAGARPETQ